MDSTTLLALCAFGFVGSMAFYVMAMLNGNDGGKIQKRLAASLQVEGFHVGFADSNPGHPVHAHIHVIPRTPGDCVVLSSDIDWVKS